MSRIPVPWRKQGASAADLGLGFQMVPIATTIQEVSTRNPICQPVFGEWTISAGSFSGFFPDVPTTELTEENSAEPIPYPDGCWYYLIGADVFTCDPDDCVEWVVTFKNADGDVAQAPPDLSVIVAETLPYFAACRGVALLFNWDAFDDGFGSIHNADGFLVGTSIEVEATVNGAQVGPTIFFACDPSAQALTWSSWAFLKEKLCPTITPVTEDFLYQRHPISICATNPDFARHSVTWIGPFWSNAMAISWVITQTAGTTFPGPIENYFVMGGAFCEQWYLYQKQQLYDYAGTAISCQAYFGGNPIGDPVAYSCEV